MARAPIVVAVVVVVVFEREFPDVFWYFHVFSFCFNIFKVSFLRVSCGFSQGFGFANVGVLLYLKGLSRRRFGNYCCSYRVFKQIQVIQCPFEAGVLQVIFCVWPYHGTCLFLFFWILFVDFENLCHY